ncbi:MAG: hypothetical protein MJ161_05675 [Clostridia bacterium]|nr:hypothetical protein [Clostridia bacterium]
MKKTKTLIGVLLAFVMTFSVVCLTGCGDPFADQQAEITAQFEDGGFTVDSLTINENGDKYDAELSTPDSDKSDEFIAEFMRDGGELFYECKYKTDEGKDAVIEGRIIKVDGKDYILKDGLVYRGAIRIFPPYVEEDMPENGKIFENNFSSRPTYIEVTNPNEEAYVIKFKDKNDKVMISFFVAPKSEVTTYMGTGDYYLSYATGKTWYGYEDLFGGETYYCKDKEAWHFESSKYWTLELQQVKDGNVHTEPIQGDEF